MKQKLFKHQKKILKEFPHKAALVWETGTGKTIAAIELAKKSKANCALFICPKGLKKNWQEQLAAHYGNRSYVVLTKEEFKKTWKELGMHEAIIVDESHYFFGMTSDISKSLINYSKKHEPAFLWLLTATPYRSSPWDIYRMAEILGRKVNYWAFRERFFNDIRFGNRRPIPIPKKDIEDDIAGMVAELGLIVKLKDCVDVPEQTFDIEYFDLTTEQKLAMLQVYDVMPIVRFTKYHQICGGTLKGDGYTPDQLFSSDKLDRVLELADTNKRLIIVCRYNNEVDVIAKTLLSMSSTKSVAIITGNVDNRHEIISKLKTLDDYVLIVNAACSEGWELPECPLMVFFSYSFSLKDYIQMIGRIQRINSVKKNTYLSLIVKETIDEDVYKALQRKEDFHVSIYSSNSLISLK